MCCRMMARVFSVAKASLNSCLGIVKCLLGCSGWSLNVLHGC